MTSERQETEQVREFSRCVWCHAEVEWFASDDRAVAEAKLREHSATCPEHPAVQALALRATPRAVPDETREARRYCDTCGHGEDWHTEGETGMAHCTSIGCLCASFINAAHPPRAGEVTEEAKLREALERIATLTYSEDANERVRLMRKDARSALGRPS